MVEVMSMKFWLVVSEESCWVTESGRKFVLVRFLSGTVL